MGTVLDILQDRRLELGPARDAPQEEGKSFRRARDEHGVEWLLLDMPGRSVNLLTEAVLEELNDILASLSGSPPNGLVIRSAKPAGFMAGADVRHFRELRTADAVEKEIGRAHQVVDRLESLPFRSVAVIHGHCLGGGLELALACRHRIAVEGARMGFPEVLLGVHPGLGGTFRSLRLIDPIEAMTMMLTGRTKSAREARRLGLVDAATEERHVIGAVRAAVEGRLQAAGGGLKKTALATKPARTVAARRMRVKTGERARREHYPSPYALIDMWEEHGGDLDEMRRAELKSFSTLLIGDTAQNLVRAFLLRDKMKRLAGRDHHIGHVHVIGAGTMGGDIAAWCARRGFRTTLADIDLAMIGRAVARAQDMLKRELREGAAIRDALDRLIPDPNGFGVGRADLVIEAVPERLELKHRIYADVEPRLKAGAILATNTSSLPLPDLSTGLQRPERFLGIHFFNPVARMQLVEVVRHDGTDAEAMDRALAFVGAIDRLPAPVQSAPGFLVNRILTPYLMEAMVMVSEGRKPELIDEAAERFGMPMGPMELADRVGLDVAASVGQELKARIDRPMPPAPEWLKKKIEAGHLGVKSGRGIYEYDSERKPKKAGFDGEPDEETVDRLILPMLDAAVACLRTGVTDDEELIDGAMIFGTGFAPFRGGPLHYARARGVGDVVSALRHLAGKFGDRFQPDDGWSRLEGGS